MSKTFTHTIYYKANTTDGATLKDATTQKVIFEGSIYIDKVTPKTTTPITIKVNGEDIQVATINPGQIIWDKSSQTMEAVDQPTITLNSGDRYTTSDSMIGTWKLVSGKADAIDLTPSSSNPKDVQLVYEKEVQPGGDTGDEPGDQPSGKPSDNPGNEPSGQPGNKGSKTPGKPDENKPDEPKKPEEKKSNKKTPQKKNPSKKSTKKSPTKSNKTKQTKQAKQSQK